MGLKNTIYTLEFCERAYRMSLEGKSQKRIANELSNELKGVALTRENIWYAISRYQIHTPFTVQVDIKNQLASQLEEKAIEAALKYRGTAGLTEYNILKSKYISANRECGIWNQDLNKNKN